MLLNQARAAGILAETKLDGLVVTTPENLLYTTGILNVNASVLPRMVQAYAVMAKDRLAAPSVVMGVGDADQYLSAFSGVGPLACFGTFYREAPDPGALDDTERRMQQLTDEATRHPTAGAALAATIRATGMAGATIGLDEDGIHAAVREEIATQLPQARFQNASALLRRIRMVKTPGEIERLERAQTACENGIKSVAAMARAGVTERDLAAAYHMGVTASGGRVTFALIKIGRNAALGQLPSGGKRLEKGAHVWFDVGAQVEGYQADLARILVLGEPSQKLLTYYAAALHGEQRAFAVTRPGMTAQQLFTATVETVRQAGIPHYRRHHVGHGIGVEVYDPPVLNGATTTPIEAGMVVNIETPYYELGWGAVHVEDPYLVGPDGRNRWLTTLPRDLIILE